MKSNGIHSSHTLSGNEGRFESSTQKTRLKRSLQYFHSTLLALLGGTALLGHMSEKAEYPNPLPRIPLLANNKVTWDEFTNKEIHKLAREYAIIYSRRQSAEKTTKEDLEKKFLEFIVTYAPDIHIAQLEKNDNTAPSRLLHRLWYEGPNRAHYFAGTVIFDIQDMRKGGNDNYDPSTSSLEVFLAELSHYLNDDTRPSRGVAYAKDYIGTGLRNTKMYSKISSSEYQAHSVTEVAIREYLEPGNTYTFPEIYNLHHSYYRKIMDGEGYEEEKDKAYLHDEFRGGDTESLLQYREIVFSNLDIIRNIINATNFDREKKSLLFRYLINAKFIGLKDIDYHQLAQNIDFSTVNTPEHVSSFYFEEPSE